MLQDSGNFQFVETSHAAKNQSYNSSIENCICHFVERFVGRQPLHHALPRHCEFQALLSKLGICFMDPYDARTLLKKRQNIVGKGSAGICSDTKVVDQSMKNPPTRVGVPSILILCRIQNLVQNKKIQNPKTEIQNPKSAQKELLHNDPKSKIQNLDHWRLHKKNCYITIQNPKSKIWTTGGFTRRIAT